MTLSSDRLLLLNLGKPSRLVAIPPEGGEIDVLGSDLGVAPDGIAVDPVGRHLFWTYMGSERQGEDFLTNDGSIERVDFDGGNRTMIVPTGQTFTPKQLQCDPQAGLIYWCDREGMRVMRARTDGSDITILVQTGATEEDRLDRRRHCVGIAIDVEGGFLYWTQKGKPNGNEGRILRAPLHLPDGMDPSRRSDVVTLFDDLPEPIDLEWDAEGSCLYWTDRGDPPAGNTLNRVVVRDGEAMTPVILLSGLQEGIGLSLDRVGRRAFVGDLSGTVRMLHLEHADDVKIVFSGHGPLTGVAYQAADASDAL
jgi:hypothetical protein